jgi:hypothetical protein
MKEVRRDDLVRGFFFFACMKVGTSLSKGEFSSIGARRCLFVVIEVGYMLGQC